jgi:3-deoxy-D-manno-octulosonic-acid transferase
VISALNVARSLKQEYPSKEIVFTVKTSQGMKIARDELEEETGILLPMPVDFWWSVRSIVNSIRPSIFILVETDLWPGLISYLKKKRVKIILINGRISPRTFKSYKRFRFFFKRMLSQLELCLMQSDLDRERLLEIGLLPEKVKTVGNIKFDRTWLPLDKKELEYWHRLLNMRPETRIWVAGSVHEGEDEIVLEVFKKLVSHFPVLRLIIAPRRLEWSEDFYRLSQIKGLKTVRRSDLPGDGDSHHVLILDTLGELGRIYGLAEISFVGGSLVQFGGHNLLEPASFGCPVIFGPYTHNFVLMSQLLIHAGGGRRVNDGEDLFESMNELLSDRERQKMMGSKAKNFVEMNRGALERVMQYIGDYIEAA